MASNGLPARASAETHTQAQRYLSTRGEDNDFSFEQVVLKGLASDGGLYIPEDVPKADDWQSWKDLSFNDLAYRVIYSTFRSTETTPLVHLKDNLHLLELFHGPTFAFKDVALQFLGNLFEYFLVRKNEGKTGKDRHHLTVVGATSGDTGSAAIYGLRGKKDVSVFILHPNGRVSPIQEAQMTTVLDSNVHNLAVTGTFDDCQDIVKALFADPEINKTHNLGAVNSINWARILAQIVYYFHSYFSLAKKDSTFTVGDKVRFVVPTGNFGDVLAGYFAHRMGLPVDKFVVATNENDILDRFFKTGRYEKKPITASTDAEEDASVKETLSPAMDILVSSNFERLLWFLAYEFAETAGMDDEWNKKQAVYQDVISSARRSFESERVSDTQTVETIKGFYNNLQYILDPHSAVGVNASERSISNNGSVPHISLSTAHPAKFAGAVELALKEEPGFNFEEKVLPPEFVGLDKREKRLTEVDNDWQKVREIVRNQVDQELSQV
ncbi:unnamed protein product [Parascedosporium putredinis]|uniref:threonine synthase n=1 Tax=Parascedosporium putredinis TaxID=1442378 RepID=A0A9P1HAE2_9PEZI|nr:unnamed protein product [Parascedosporium putredinis]CAI8001255.1 unnamed protein product [Parascedosporium putredinis]